MLEGEIRKILNVAQQALNVEKKVKDQQSSATEKVAQKDQPDDQHSDNKKKEKEGRTQSGNNNETQHSEEKKEEEKDMIHDDAVDVMEFYNTERDREESKEKRLFVCHICHKNENKTIKWAFAIFNALVMHTQNWHMDSTDVDKDLYYWCTAFNCHEVFKSYEQQLDHRLDHDELYCRFCRKFFPTHLKTGQHERILSGK